MLILIQYHPSFKTPKNPQPKIITPDPLLNPPKPEKRTASPTPSPRPSPLVNRESDHAPAASRVPQNPRSIAGPRSSFSLSPGATQSRARAHSAARARGPAAAGIIEAASAAGQRKKIKTGRLHRLALRFCRGRRYTRARWLSLCACARRAPARKRRRLKSRRGEAEGQMRGPPQAAERMAPLPPEGRVRRCGGGPRHGATERLSGGERPFRRIYGRGRWTLTSQRGFDGKVQAHRRFLSGLRANSF